MEYNKNYSFLNISTQRMLQNPNLTTNPFLFSLASELYFFFMTN